MSVCHKMTEESTDGAVVRKKMRSQSIFGQLEIVEDDESDIIEGFSEVVIIDKLEQVSTIDAERSNSIALSYNSGMTTSKKLEEADQRRKLRMEKKNLKRATKIVTSGAMTFLLLAATLVTVSFLLSPTIEKIFGRLLRKFPLFRVKLFLVYSTLFLIQHCLLFQQTLIHSTEFIRDSVEWSKVGKKLNVLPPSHQMASNGWNLKSTHSVYCC